MIYLGLVGELFSFRGFNLSLDDAMRILLFFHITVKNKRRYKLKVKVNAFVINMNQTTLNSAIIKQTIDNLFTYIVIHSSVSLQMFF